MRPPAANGGPSGRPRPAVDPHQPWRVNSVAAHSVHGPSSPNPPVSTRTSAVAHSSPTVASPGAATTDRFEVWRNSKSAPEPHERRGSPSGGSTLTTSAPASASSFVQYGPAISVEQSTTRIPSSNARGLPD